jgi:hypothetical protein
MHEFLSFRLDIVNQCLWRRHENAADERMALTPGRIASSAPLLRWSMG